MYIPHYGQQTGSMHPIEMLSCLLLFLVVLIYEAYIDSVSKYLVLWTYFLFNDYKIELFCKIISQSRQFVLVLQRNAVQKSDIFQYAPVMNLT